MTAADQTERWTLHRSKYGMGGHCAVLPSWWATTDHCMDYEHIPVVPAAALDAAREEIERLKGRVDAENERFDKFLREDHAILRHRAEQAEAELAKAKAVIEAFRVMLREPYKIQEIDGWKDAVKALSILDEKANP